ncbi:9267_t:CDS:2 [Ambispora leptoticha]|uniref:9267_t:CDS:1 n=1 Tax=Ambispora leptoticha TaxID=144679 RepID=A0A9N8VB66_9GLOM|nr:9267_t:CDS:2 [Ambispora leptoticha]
MTNYFRRSVLPSRLVTRQPLKIALRNSNPPLFLSRPYTNSAPNESASFAWKKKWDPVQIYLRSINWKQRISGLWGLLWRGGAVFLTGDLVYLWWVSQSNERRVNKFMEKGTRPQDTVSEDKLIPRPEIVERLKKIFQPGEDHSYYHVVCGEHGTGKTTLTVKVAREIGKGVIYVDTPADIEEFGNSFGKALNLIFDEDAMLTLRLKRKFFGYTKDELDPKWKRAFRAFKHASEVYKAKHGKPPVIIYDNISRIFNENPKILDILQDDAKDNADDSKYIAVFVSSEGSVPRRMESRSAWSRADKPVMEIGDLSEKESIDYLINKRKINSVEAKKLYELVGGRIVDLKSVAGKFLAGQSFEVIKQQILTEVKKKFGSAGLLRNQSHHEAGKHVISALLDSKEIDTDVFREFFKDKEFGEVLEANVFAYHPSRDTVTFQSQSVECYIRENASSILISGEMTLRAWTTE